MKLQDLLEKIDDPKLAYHDELNPKLWNEKDGSYELNLKVKQKLVKITDEFITSLGIQPSQVKDYVFTGSNANYNWTSLSDIDLHVILDMKAECKGCKSINVKDCIDAKKSLWNDRHDITIYGFPVELYAADVSDRLVGDAGVYSLLYGKWLTIPEKKNIKLDSKLITVKADDLAQQVDDLIASKTDDKNTIKELTRKLANYRKAGLAKGGEFSVENLVWKSLRNNGYIDKIRKYALKAQDHTLSLEESLNSIVDFSTVKDTTTQFITKATIGERVITFVANEEEPSKWHVEFYELSDENKKLFNVTKRGHEFQVFSMVKKSMEELISKRDPSNILFVSDKQDVSRAKLYEKLLNRFLSGYKIIKGDKKNHVTFKLVKKSKGKNEIPQRVA